MLCRSAVIAVLALSLGAPGVHSAWLQAGFDAARTGSTPDAGPVSDDVAWTVYLPGSRAQSAPPLVLDGQVYVLVADWGAPWSEDLRANGIFRVPLASAEPELFIAMETPPSAFASDGQRFYVTRNLVVEAYDLALGRRAWSQAFPPVVPAHGQTRCMDVAVRDGVVYVACQEQNAVRSGVMVAGEGDFTYPRVAYVAALEAATGDVRWRWVKNATAELQPEDRAAIQSPLGLEPSAHLITVPQGLAVIGPSVYLTTLNLDSRAASKEFAVYSLSERHGALQWRKNTTFDPYAYWVEYQNQYASGVPTGTADVVYMKLDELLAVNPVTSEVLWHLDIGREDGVFLGNASGMALHEDALFVTSFQTLYRVDTTTRQVAWRASFTGQSEETWGNTFLAVAGGVVYGRSTANAPPITNTFHAHDAATGALIWRYTTGNYIDDHLPYHTLFSVAEGVFAMAGIDGTLTVLGRTPASIVPRSTVSSAFPAPNETLSVDLTASLPGAHGPASRFRADWGDGTSQGWQRSPAFTHQYQQRNEYRARFWAGNDAGQTASEEFVFDVGGTPPPSPLLQVERAAAPEAPRPWPFDAVVIAILGVVAVAGTAAGGALVHRRGSGKATPPPGGPVLEPVSLAKGRLVLGKYRVLGLLGEGSFGKTFLAEDTVLRRKAVIKALRTDTGGDPGALREARSIAALQHPNVVTLYDIAQAGPESYIVMEYAAGGSLAQRLARGPLAPGEFRRVATGVLRALEAVHGAGIVHRDVKPSNILLMADGEPKLADFGVAHLPGFEATLGVAGAAVGSVRFMSREQARGKRVTAQSDLFSAGASLYEAYAGKRYLEPRPDESAMELQLRAAAARSFDKPFAGPPALRAWFAQALEPLPERRFASARAMREALERALAS